MRVFLGTRAGNSGDFTRLTACGTPPCSLEMPSASTDVYLVFEDDENDELIGWHLIGALGETSVVAVESVTFTIN
jgi:hypothetical protein